jgi:capsule polysaccharide export protein KpsE/RkpR
VRKANDAAQAGLSLGSILGGGNQQSLEDARYLRTYLQSPQVLEDLDRVLDFKAAYAKKGLDIYAGLGPNASRERAFEFFKRQVSISLNEGSGEMAIRTYGFTPNGALVLNQFLISQAEVFVNRLNQDVYRKQIDFALQQVKLNADRVKIASQQLQQYSQALPSIVLQRARHVISENERVLSGVAALRAGNVAEFGRLMNASHASMRDDYNVSIPEMDALVASAQRVSGCYGSRLTGAGFGGCTVSLVENGAVEHFRHEVAAAYLAATGRSASIYVTHAADGVGRVRPE